MTVLVTGAAGFIGYHVAEKLLQRGEAVLGIDNLNDYYDVSLKEARLARLNVHSRFAFQRLDVGDRIGVAQMFSEQQPRRVIHLAAQAGVPYSLVNPHAYVDSNLVGFVNILEGSRHTRVDHLVYASSSSVYGANVTMPFSEHHNVDHPISLYAATKKANELMAHTYSHLFGLPTTGLRFFTVYGPWGRPDMALFKFTKGIVDGAPIEIYNNGNMVRDFTYIDDIVEGVVRVANQPPVTNSAWSSANGDPATSAAPYRIFNIGNNRPVQLLRYIEVLEQCLGRKAIKELKPLRPGDVPATVADTADLERAVGFRPTTPVEVGVARFVEWYLEHFAAA